MAKTKVPDKELIYYLGEGYGRMRIPEAVKILKEKGLAITGKMTLRELFDVVRKAYKALPDEEKKV